jgi:hypothetical protein
MNRALAIEYCRRIEQFLTIIASDSDLEAISLIRSGFVINVMDDIIDIKYFLESLKEIKPDE